MVFSKFGKTFNPEIEKINVPMKNPYILKMQATTFLIDWIGRMIGLRKSISILDMDSNENKFKHVRKKATLLITKILKLEKEYYDFRNSLFYLIVNTRQFSDFPKELNELIDNILWFSQGLF